ncbi:MAG TPA: hypothetical protein VF941_01265 [Clostridia bacterium]
MRRGFPLRYKRYVPLKELTNNLNPIEDNFADTDIPLPNEAETEPEVKASERGGISFPSLSFLKKIRIDDLILLGIIVLFLDEGRGDENRGEAEDDFLIIIILYLFLSGLH